jgi:hypothetical protein
LISVLHKIEDEGDKTSSMTLFTSIWNATANMERYVQYGFSTTQRDVIFGKDWGILFLKMLLAYLKFLAKM